jgi:hypothetical protein
MTTRRGLPARRRAPASALRGSSVRLILALLLGAVLGLAVGGPSPPPAQSPCAQALAAAEARFERGT